MGGVGGVAEGVESPLEQAEVMGVERWGHLRAGWLVCVPAQVRFLMLRGCQPSHCSSYQPCQVEVSLEGPRLGSGN